MSISKYKTVIVVGETEVKLDTVRKAVNVLPTEATADAVKKAIVASGLKDHDVVRGDALVFLDMDSYRSITTYAALCAIAGRRLDVVANGELIHAGALSAEFATFPKAKAFNKFLSEAQYGAEHEGMSSKVGPVLSPKRIRAISQVLRLRYVPSENVNEAVIEFLALTEWRKKGVERWPWLVQGDEPTFEDFRTVVGVDLEALRRDCQNLLIPAVEQEVIEAEAVSSRTARTAAAAKNVEAVASLLNLRTDSGKVHCPNGRNHILKISETGFTCRGCGHAEELDALAMYVYHTGAGVDGAVDTILNAN